jgi:hypothetical protein
MPTRGEFVNRVWAQESHRLARWIVRLVATKTASIPPECHRLVRWIVTLPSYEPETPPVEPVGSFRRLRMLYLATSVTLHGTRPWHLGNHVRPCAWPRRGLPMRASPPFGEFLTFRLSATNGLQKWRLYEIPSFSGTCCGDERNHLHTMEPCPNFVRRSTEGPSEASGRSEIACNTK